MQQTLTDGTVLWSLGARIGTPENVVCPDFDTFVVWLVQALSPEEARALANKVETELSNLCQLPNATNLEASLERFLEVLHDYHDLDGWEWQFTADTTAVPVTP